MLLHVFVVLVVLVTTTSCQQLPLTRPPNVDIWNPFGATTTPEPLDRIAENPNDVIVPLSIGKVVGRRQTLSKLMWTVDRDIRDTPPNDRGRFGWEPLQRENNVTVFTFLGVPYAEPPTSDRRFKPPQKLRKFAGDGTIRAFQYKDVCAQDVRARAVLWYEEPYEWQTNEDCLYLNIFSPEVSASSERSFGVIVFLHGGNFQTGAANDWPGHVLASKGVVVVTVNYRLGVFGFLSTGAPGSGNFGLMDQRVAIDWVHEHIYAFSGDAGRITVIGHDAGAVSAGLHMLMPSTPQDLFHAVGAMSGAEVSYHQVIHRPQVAYNNTRQLGQQVGCVGQTMTDIWSCILTRSTDDIIMAARSMIIEYNRFSFLPVVEGQYIPLPPEVMLREKLVRMQVPYLTGVNENDGTEVLLSERDLADFTSLQFNVDNQFIYDRILDFTLKHNYTDNREAIIQAIKYLYTYWPDPRSDERAREMYIHFGSDAYYVSPVSKSAQMHSRAGSFTYMYVNNYNFSTGALNENERWLPYWMGPCHDCDLYLLFGFPWMPPELLPKKFQQIQWTWFDRNASEVFMSMFRQFADSKNPNLPNDYITWPNMDYYERWYLAFNYTLRKIKRDYDWEHMAFWNEYIEQLAYLFTTTFSPTIASWRKQIEGYKATTGVFVTLFMLMTILSGVFAYLLYERPRRQRMKEAKYAAMTESHTDTSMWNQPTMGDYPAAALPQSSQPRALGQAPTQLAINQSPSGVITHRPYKYGHDKRPVLDNIAGVNGPQTRSMEMQQHPTYGIGHPPPQYNSVV